MTTTKDLTITREFNAPRDLIWKALTDPQPLAEWWGPKGFTWIRGTLDLRPGGVFHYGMRAPGKGPEMWGKWVYETIDPPHKMTFTNGFADEAGNFIRAPFSAAWPLQVHNTWTLAEHHGKTTLTMRGHPVNATEAELKTFEAAHGSMQLGFAGTFDQLAAYLARA